MVGWFIEIDVSLLVTMGCCFFQTARLLPCHCLVFKPFSLLLQRFGRICFKDYV